MPIACFQGCRTSDPFSFISNYRAKLASASVVAGTFINAIDKFGTSQLSQVCGTNVTTTVDALNVLQSSMKSLLGTAQQAESLLACERINLIYVQAVHESLCRNAVNGLTWVIVCLIVISICGMIMIGLRSALLHIKYRDKTVELAQCVPFDAPERLQTRKESYCSDQNFERNSVPESHTQSISHSWEDQHVNTRSIPSHSSEDQHVNNQRTSHSWQNQHAENIEMDFNASTHSRRPPAEAPLGQSSSSEVSQVVAYIPDNAKHCSFGQPKEYDRAGASRESWNDDCEAGNAVPGDHDLGSKDDNSLAEYQNESFEHEHEESSLSDSCEGYPTRFEISTSNSLDEGLLPSISQDAAIVCSDYRQNATSEV